MLHRIPYYKAQGAGNDFLISWREQVAGLDPSAVARAICDRHRGIGADGWYVLARPASNTEAVVEAQLYNADGSLAEVSGNGTRCIAAVLLAEELAGPELTIQTGAGPKFVRLLARQDLAFEFEVAMGNPRWQPDELNTPLRLSQGVLHVSIVHVGNPQCVVFVDAFPPNWSTLAAEIERHPRFPNRTNVSFVRVLDPQHLEARFYERGVGQTLSSGTGAVGAAVAAILNARARSPVEVLTRAGSLRVRWEDQLYLAGPAQILGKGEFYYTSAYYTGTQLVRP